jgi:hypothetical protein
MGFGRRIHGGFFGKAMIFASTNHPPAPWKVPLLGLAHSTGLASRSGWLQPAGRMGFGKRIHGGFLEKNMIFASTNHPPAPGKVPLLGLAHSSELFEQGLARPCSKRLLLTKGACVKERLAPACRADGFRKEDSWRVL